MKLQPSLGWRLFNWIRRVVEDRGLKDAHLVGQMKALRQRSDRRRTEMRSLRVIEGRKVA